MAQRQLAITDLPLGIAATEDAYNALLAGAVQRLDAGEQILAGEIAALRRTRRAVWSSLQARKDRGMVEYTRDMARAYGFDFAGDGGLRFEWKREDHARIGFDSQCYGCDRATRSLVPVELAAGRPRMVVFSTGRAFAERNARLLHLTPEQAMANARDIMSAQAYLVDSRLVAAAAPGEVAVAAFAYDMVTSELEVPAIRLQAVLAPGFVHPVCPLAAERLFGPLIADAELTDRGTFARRGGRIRGRRRPDDDVIEALGGLVFVGGSVGCLLALQIGRCLAGLLAELGFSDGFVDRALGTFLVLNLGLASMPEVDPRINHLAVVNRWDEFVYAGHDTAPLVTAAERAGRRLVPYRDAAGRQPGRSRVLLLDVASTVHEDPQGQLVFDPDGTHFGHSIKHYLNALRDRGVPALLERYFALGGPFDLAELIEKSVAAGELDLSL